MLVQLAIVDAHPQFNDFIISLATGNEHYKTCISAISDEAKLGAYDQELVLRFFSLKNAIKDFKHDVADFLTEYMEQVSDPDDPRPFDFDEEKRVFDKTFKILHAALGENAFSRIARGNLVRGFAVYHFEAFTIGIQPLLDKIDIETDEGRAKIHDAIMKIKVDSDFIDQTTGGGKNSPGQLRRRIEFVTASLSQVY